jgi:hypothetical protein
LPDLRRYRVVLIDESQNLRNREGKRYRVILDYIVWATIERGPKVTGVASCKLR